MSKDKKYYVFRLNVSIVNILSIVIMIILGLVLFFCFKVNVFRIIFDTELSIILLTYLGWAILHEIIHSIGYLINGGKWNKIVYGIGLEKGILYCLCKQNISRKNILISSMLPLIVIGFITLIIGCYYNIDLLILLSVFNISGSIGDIVTFMYISKLKKDVYFSEMDDIISFAIYSDYDVSKIKHYGIDYIECVDSVSRKDLKKIRISKFSIVVLLLLVLLSCIF